MVEEIFGSNLNRAISLHCINIGFGDCLLIQTPSNKNILIDINCKYYGFHFLKTYLRAYGVTKDNLSLIVISHAEADHTSGLLKIIKDFEIPRDNIWISPFNPYTTNEIRTGEDYYAIFDQSTIAYQGVERKIDTIQIKVLAPADELIAEGLLNMNSSSTKLSDLSLVLEIDCFGGIEKGGEPFARIILPGDLTQEGWNQFAKNNTISCDFLKVAHHGSTAGTPNQTKSSSNQTTNSSAEFDMMDILENKPIFTFISQGPMNHSDDFYSENTSNKLKEIIKERLKKYIPEENKEEAEEIAEETKPSEENNIIGIKPISDIIHPLRMESLGQLAINYSSEDGENNEEINSDSEELKDSPFIINPPEKISPPSKIKPIIQSKSKKSQTKELEEEKEGKNIDVHELYSVGGIYFFDKEPIIITKKDFEEELKPIPSKTALFTQTFPDQKKMNESNMIPDSYIFYFIPPYPNFPEGYIQAERCYIVPQSKIPRTLKPLNLKYSHLKSSKFLFKQ